MPKSDGLSNLRPVRTPEQKALLDQARADAEEVRSAWLVGMRQGIFDIQDIVDAAEVAVQCRVSSSHAPVGTVCSRCAVNAPLLKVKLRDVLMAVPGWGEARAARVLSRFTYLVHHFSSKDRIPVPDVPTLSWLLHPQAGPSRMLFWWDAVGGERPLVPWEGFPFTAEPVPEVEEVVW